MKTHDEIDKKQQEIVPGAANPEPFLEWKYKRDTLNPLKGMSFLQITHPKTTCHFRDTRTLPAAFGMLCKTTSACAQATTTPGLSKLTRK